MDLSEKEEGKKETKDSPHVRTPLSSTPPWMCSPPMFLQKQERKGEMRRVWIPAAKRNDGWSESMSLPIVDFKQQIQSFKARIPHIWVTQQWTRRLNKTIHHFVDLWAHF